jgi:hypothetical protein
VVVLCWVWDMHSRWRSAALHVEMVHYTCRNSCCLSVLNSCSEFEDS